MHSDGWGNLIVQQPNKTPVTEETGREEFQACQLSHTNLAIEETEFIASKHSKPLSQHSIGSQMQI